MRFSASIFDAFAAVSLASSAFAKSFSLWGKFSVFSPINSAAELAISSPKILSRPLISPATALKFSVSARKPSRFALAAFTDCSSGAASLNFAGFG